MENETPTPSLQTLKLRRIIVKSLSTNKRERGIRSWMIHGRRGKEKLLNPLSRVSEVG